MKKFIALFRDMELDVYADTREEARSLALSGFVLQLENELEVVEMKARTERCGICQYTYTPSDGSASDVDIDLIKYFIIKKLLIFISTSRTLPQKRKELQLLNKLMEQSGNPLLQERWWVESGKLIQLYLKSRACDIYVFGKKCADITYPLPTDVRVIQGASYAQVTKMVDFMVQLLEDDYQQDENRREQLKYAEHQEYVQKKFDEKFRNKSLPVPASLASRALSRSEIESTLQSCRNQFLHYDREKSGNLVQGTLKAIDDFVEFCTLLSKPENHIKIPSGQYIEREVTTRSFLDMEAEMAWELTNLPKHTAYVRVTQEQGGAHTVVKRKMKTSLISVIR